MRRGPRGQQGEAVPVDEQGLEPNHRQEGQRAPAGRGADRREPAGRHGPERRRQLQLPPRPGDHGGRQDVRPAERDLVPAGGRGRQDQRRHQHPPPPGVGDVGQRGQALGVGPRRGQPRVTEERARAQQRGADAVLPRALPRPGRPRPRPPRLVGAAGTPRDLRHRIFCVTCDLGPVISVAILMWCTPPRRRGTSSQIEQTSKCFSLDLVYLWSGC